VLTGDLNATFNSNPAFPGKERHLLRAQLARIFHATAIHPIGLFEADEETGETKFAEEFAMPATDKLLELESWGNTYPQILKIGRTKHLYEETPDEWDDKRKEDYEAMKEADQVVDAFRPINEHAKI
jgi:hypothetical protein